MEITKMETPKTRSEFERNLNILVELLRNDKLRFADHLEYTVESLLRVKSLPNKRIDLHSVNEMARLQANQMANMAMQKPIDKRVEEEKQSASE